MTTSEQNKNARAMQPIIGSSWAQASCAQASFDMQDNLLPTPSAVHRQLIGGRAVCDAQQVPPTAGTRNPSILYVKFNSPIRVLQDLFTAFLEMSVIIH